MITVFSDNVTWSVGLIIFLFGIIAAHRLTLHRNRKERHNNIYSTFYDSFIPAIQILSKEPGTFTQNDFISFQGLFPTQETTMLKLRDLLKSQTLRRFDNCWTEYKNWAEQCNTYEHCVITIGIKSNREKLLHIIHELQKIAK